MTPRVLIVADGASARFGGEAALPLHYFRVLRGRKVPVWLLVNARNRAELSELFPDDGSIVYVSDTFLHKLLFKVAVLLPDSLSYFTFGFLLRLITQMNQRSVARSLVKKHRINVVHQPTPVSPKEPSMIFDMGAPVVIGPMNGGMSYPPGFSSKIESPWVRMSVGLGRKASELVHTLMPGKLKANLLIVANERTRQALPKGVSSKVVELVENGVDLSLWQGLVSGQPKPVSPVTQFVFVGRLVHWKAVNLLLLAFRRAASEAPVSLHIIGNGDIRGDLEQQAQELNLLGSEPDQPGKVFFHGWLSQSECAKQLEASDVLVLPSLYECGGAVVLEAMAKQLPVIATNWGGPADYLDPTCGILVDPISSDSFVSDFADAMVRLAGSPLQRQAMGIAGRRKILETFDWEAKVDKMLDIYQTVISGKPFCSEAEPAERLPNVLSGRLALRN